MRNSSGILLAAGLVPTFRSSCNTSARTFQGLRKVMGTSKFMILVPPVHLKFLDGIRRLRCKNFKWAALALGLALSPLPASAQQQQPAPQLKPVSASAMQAARDLLAVKNVSMVYNGAVPNIIERAKAQLLANNLNYQKDLNEIAQTIAQEHAGKEKEIGEQMAKIYANDFTEQEMKDLTAFYKSPLGQKVLQTEPKSIQQSMAFMGQWAQSFGESVVGEFRAQMQKRGKPLG